MQTYQLRARLLAPLSLKQDRQSDRSETIPFVTGTAVRGALAAVYLQQNGEVDEPFQRLFLDSSHCQFGPLDPGERIFPLTMTCCKRNPEDHRQTDHLWYRIAQHLTELSLPDAADSSYRQCVDCGADMKASGGFGGERDGGITSSVPAERRVSAHVGIDRTTRTAADGMFYTLESICPSDREYDLLGSIQLSDDAVADLRKLLDQEDGVVHIGHHRSRGFGQIQLQLSESATSSSATDTSTWIEWNDKLAEFLRAQKSDDGGSSKPDEDFVFSISLPNGAVLVDDLLRYSTDLSVELPWLPALPDPANLFPLSDRPMVELPDGATIRSAAAVADQQLLRGWNAAHGLPRQDDWMIRRGAVYVYWLHGSPSQRDALCNRLAQLAESGIGLRRNEGFGRVVISDPIHIQHPDEEI